MSDPNLIQALDGIKSSIGYLAIVIALRFTSLGLVFGGGFRITHKSKSDLE